MVRELNRSCAVVSVRYIKPCKHVLCDKAEQAGCEEEEKDDGATCLKKLTISGGNDEGVTPVPIPNTEVKPFSADGT